MSLLQRRSIERAQPVHQELGGRPGVGMPSRQLSSTRFYTARGINVGGFRTIQDHLAGFPARKAEAVRRKLSGVAQ